MKVRYVKPPRYGYIPDQEKAKKYLTLGEVYNVRCTKIGKFHTDYYLSKFPGIAFNSVMFEKEVSK
jgi:hypothetical protein